MNTKRTALLAIILSCIIFYTVRYEIPAEESLKKMDLLLSSIKKEDIDSISIKLPSEEYSFTKNKESQKWFLSSVENGLLDESKIANLLTSMESLKKGYAIPKEEVQPNKEQYGLASPEVVLIVNGEKIFFGKRNDYLGDRYIQKQNDETVYLADDVIYETLTKPSKYFRDVQPIRILDSEVKEIKLKNSQVKEISLMKIKEGAEDPFSWRVKSSGEEFVASKENAEKLLRDLRNTRTADFIDKLPIDLAQYGLSSPAMELTIVRRDGDPLEVRYGKVSMSEGDSTAKEKSAKEKSYISVSGYPSVFELTPGDIDGLASKSLQDLKEKRLFQFNAEKVKSIKFEGERFLNNIEIKKVNGEWKIGEEVADSTFVETFVRAVSGVEAKSFNKTAFDASKPHSKVVVDEEGGAKTLRISNNAEAEGILSSVDGLGEPFYLSGEELKKISPNTETLKKPESLPTTLPTAPTK